MYAKCSVCMLHVRREREREREKERKGREQGGQLSSLKWLLLYGVYLATLLQLIIQSLLFHNSGTLLGHTALCVHSCFEATVTGTLQIYKCIVMNKNHSLTAVILLSTPVLQYGNIMQTTSEIRTYPKSN